MQQFIVEQAAYHHTDKTTTHCRLADFSVLLVGDTMHKYGHVDGSIQPQQSFLAVKFLYRNFKRGC